MIFVIGLWTFLRALFLEPTARASARRPGGSAEVVLHIHDQHRRAAGLEDLVERPYLSVDHYERLQAALGAGDFVDASTLIEELRLVKSPAELAYHRQAATIAVQGMRAAIAAAAPGRMDNEVAAASLSALISGGSGLRTGPLSKSDNRPAVGTPPGRTRASLEVSH